MASLSELKVQLTLTLEEMDTWGHVTGLSEPKVRDPRDRVTYSTLTEAQVLEINRRLKSGSRKQDLAELFDVSYSTIHAIEKGRAWGWLTGNKRNKEA